MNGKKDPSRYTIKFDINDYDHMQAMQMLDKAGRRKAELISKALAFYARHGRSASGYAEAPPPIAPPLPEVVAPQPKPDIQESNAALDSAIDNMAGFFPV